MGGVVEPKCFPLSMNQQRLWILDQLQPGIAANHIPVCLRLTGPLAYDALERSLEAIVARHGSLRTTFGFRDSAPLQAHQAVLRDSPAIAGYERASWCGLGGAGAIHLCMKKFKSPST